jgi:hypothetical protein
MPKGYWIASGQFYQGFESGWEISIKHRFGWVNVSITTASEM